MNQSSTSFLDNLETTSNGIPYDDTLQTPYGKRIVLYPTEGIHSLDDIKVAKLDLIYKRDVAGFKIEWKPNSTLPVTM